jgi:peptide/nickel transport system substrate-binding protein
VIVITSLIRKTQRVLWATIALAVVAVVVGACGSGSGSSGTGAGTAALTVSGVKQTGPGLTEPTKPSGQKLKGGTVTFAEEPGAPPNYIFPMYSDENCGLSNSIGLNDLLYRPLYWFGDNYKASIDYNISLGRKPTFSNGGKTVTIKLNNYKWSNGEQVSARDIVFWMNVLKANPAKEWCLYAPGRFPSNVVSYKAINTNTVQLTFNRAYDPTWLIYNELAQIYPIPLAWDKTSMSGPTPTPNSSSAPDLTKAGATKVYNFLNAQSLKISDWGSSPLWRVVDGPWQVQSTTTSGSVTFVPNKNYSGSQKPQISKFVELPFTSESALVDEIKSQGPSAITVGYIPQQYQPLTSSLENAGYDVNLASTYQTFYFALNQNNPTVGPIFRQLYFRQALQHLVNQNGWIHSFLHNTAVENIGPVPLAPSSPLVKVSAANNPYPYSVSAASKLLKDNGWKVVPGGSTHCVRPGSAAGDCGAGVKPGQVITFNIDYLSGVTAVSEEMLDLQSQASKVGVKINLTTHPYDTISATNVKCTPQMASCRWTSENYGGGWLYYNYPTGENLFDSTAVENTSSYNSPQMNKLIDQTITAPESQEAAAMQRYVSYTEKQLPVVFVPASVGAWGFPTAGTLIDSKLGGFTANAFGFLNPEDWYLTK